MDIWIASTYTVNSAAMNIGVLLLVDAVVKGFLQE